MKITHKMNMPKQLIVLVVCILIQFKLHSQSRIDNLQTNGIPVIIEFEDTLNLNRRLSNIKLNHIVGNIYTACLNEDGLNYIQCINGVKEIFISNQYNGFKPVLDEANKHTKVVNVHQGLQNNLSKNYSGSNVIVGVVDIGFQTNNRTFYTEDGSKLRIKRFWDQGDVSGPPPSGFIYGKECSTENDIVNQVDRAGSHATLVAGIAGGSGYGTLGNRYRGVAYNADLVFVKIKYTNNVYKGGAFADYYVAAPSILDAFKYIFDYADKEGKPAVINLSWICQVGPHDGSSLFDRTLDALLNEKKGRAIVGGVGNDGNRNLHLSHVFKQDTLKAIPIDQNRLRVPFESILVDAWGSKNMNFKFRVHLYDTFKNVLATSKFYTTDKDSSFTFSLNKATDSARVVARVVHKNNANDKPNVLFEFRNNRPRRRFLMLEIAADSGRIDLWNSGDAYRYSTGEFVDRLFSADLSAVVKKGDNRHTLGENGGTAKSIISVGAYNNKNAWKNYTKYNFSSSLKVGDSAKMSSYGPTVDGRIKPEITAPGIYIVSSANKYAFNNLNANELIDISVINKDTNYWTINSGTSLAAPQVTGVVALMFQLDPDLNYEEIRNLIIESADRDVFTSSKVTNKWGYGKLNALTIMKKLETKLSIRGVYLNDAYSIYPNPSEAFVEISGFGSFDSVRYQILNGQGQHVQTGFLSSISRHIDITGFKPGVYELRISDSSGTYNYRIVKL